MSLFGSLELGKKSLVAAQMGQATTGHNIANVDTEGFSRQELIQRTGTPTSKGRGQGVDVDGIRRIQDGFTQQKIVSEQIKLGGWETKERILVEAEALFTDLDGTKLRNSMSEFWDAWSQVANQPENPAMRRVLVGKGESLANGFNLFVERLEGLHSDINSRIGQEVLEANQIMRDVAELNAQVEQMEKRGINANDARDRREMMLQKLSSKVELRWFEDKRGIMQVQIPNGQNLIHGRKAFFLTAIKTTDGGNFRLGLNNPQGGHTDITDLVKSGGIKELIVQRDGNIKNYIDHINSLAREMGMRVNSIHASGTGIGSLRQIEKSAYSMTPERISQPLPYLKSGILEFKLTDQAGNLEESIAVEVEAGKDTLLTLVDKINKAADAFEPPEEGKEPQLKEITKFKAQIGEDGAITLKAGMGKRFIHGPDQTGSMAVLGLNSFFHVLGGAADIRINPEFIDNEMMVATGQDLIPSDNSIALAIADLRFEGTMIDGTATFDEFYNSQITDVGLKVQDAQNGRQNHTEMLDQYKALRDSVSAVNLDEEMANMVKYQRAYETSAKFMGTVNEMTQTLVNM